MANLFIFVKKINGYNIIARVEITFMVSNVLILTITCTILYEWKTSMMKKKENPIAQP